jgi:hypothetical protein
MALLEHLLPVELMAVQVQQAQQAHQVLVEQLAPQVLLELVVFLQV